MYNLVGVDGNALSIINYVKNAMSSDYYKLLALSEEKIEEINSKFENKECF